MKKQIFILAILIFASFIVSSQTLADKRAIKKIDKELLKLESDLRINESKGRCLVPDTTAIATLKAKYVAEKTAGNMSKERYNALGRQITNLENRLISAREQAKTGKYLLLKNEREDILNRIAELENDRELLIDKQIDNAWTERSPKELTDLEYHRRGNGYQNARRDLSLKKMNSICAEGSQMGYPGLIWNNTRHTPANFIICDPSGEMIDGGSFYLQPGESRVVYLLPGHYLAKNSVYGHETSCRPIISEPKVAVVNGQQYCWFFIKDSEGY